MTEQIFICFDQENDFETQLVERTVLDFKSKMDAKNKIKFKWFTKKKIPKNEAKLKEWINKELKDTKKTIIFVWINTLNLPYIQYIIKKSEEKQNEIIKIPLMKNKNDYFTKSLWWWVWSLWWWFTIITPGMWWLYG